MKINYYPEADSLAGKVCAFFQRNPDEELDADGIKEKFEVASAAGVHTSLSRSVEHGLLTRTQNEDKVWCYKRGEKLAVLGAPGSAAASAVAAAQNRQFNTGPLAIDVATVELKKGVPLPPTRGAKTHDWDTLFRRMEKGDSVTLPLRVRATLTKAAAAYCAGCTGVKFAMRKIGNDQVGLWRIE